MTTSTDQRPTTISTTLRTLYLARFGFAITWATLLAFTASSISVVSGTLLVLYPVVDLVAAVVDHRASRATRHTRLLLVNVGLSALAAVGLALAVGHGLPSVLVVWGAWAITAGAVQLAVAIPRRPLGGQWPMILSGGISTVAGAGFVLQSGGPDASLGALAGYATLGGLFFLASAVRLRACRAPAQADGQA